MKLRRITVVFVALAMGLAGCKTTTTSTRVVSNRPQIISVKKIWDRGKHNAFTDLIRFNHQWFCCFRESVSHVAGDGIIRMLASKDGENWQSAAVVAEKGVDLRDPKLSITPDHRLMLNCVGAIRESPKLTERQSRVAFSKDGFNWTDPQRILETNDWLWRVTWQDHKAYGVVYTALAHKKSTSQTNTWSTRLVESDNGVQFRTVAVFNIPDEPNEATARFLKNGDCVVLIRREAGDKKAWIGRSSAPYNCWQWRSTDLFVGGPDFLILNDGSMVAAGREINASGANTFVGRMNLESITPVLTLPGGGGWDCSYPGLVWHDGLLWVSYYSSHEGKTSIYLAKIKF